MATPFACASLVRAIKPTQLLEDAARTRGVPVWWAWDLLCARFLQNVFYSSTPSGTLRTALAAGDAAQPDHGDATPVVLVLVPGDMTALGLHGEASVWIMPHHPLVTRGVVPIRTYRCFGSDEHAL